jgi:Ca-activated chloride channel homolog
MNAAGLSYVLSHPLSLGIESIRPAAWIFVLALPLFFLLRTNGGRRASLLRAAAFLAAVSALAGLRLTTALPDEKLTLIAAVDVSDSVGDAGREWANTYLNEVVRNLSPGDEIGIITFAREAQVWVPPGPPEAVGDIPAIHPATATNLAAALETAAALLPAEGERRILLLTDGNETEGNSRVEIARLRRAKARVYAAAPPPAPALDTWVEKVIAPSVVSERDPVPIRVLAFDNGGPRSGVLSLFLDGQITDSIAVELQPGLNSLDLTTKLRGPGNHRLRARVEVPNDANHGNDEREIPIAIRAATRVMLVTPRSHSPLAHALTHKGIRVDVRLPSQFPVAVQDLHGYQAVVFEDVTYGAFAPHALATLERFVRDLGGGFVIAGGSATFGDQRYADTPLQQVVPVTFEPTRPHPGEREPLALFIVIDRSNSMGYNSRIGTLRDGEKLRYAKEAALAVVRQLRDQDLVGMIAFDSQPYELAPLQPLRENRAKLEQMIPRLVENGGTDFFDALVSARDQLANSRIHRRHIILLTDGDTNRSSPDEYRNLIQRIAAENISVTTIRMGDNTVNLALLRQISEGTNGQFHYVEDAQMLPDLVLRDTSRAVRSTGSRGDEFYPQVRTQNQLLRGIEERNIPPLAAYAYSKPKPGAEVVLQVNRLERHDPLLAVWRHGLGRVAAFTASPIDDAENWLGWKDASKFWSQLVHWVEREHTEADYLIDAHRRGSAVAVVVQTFGPGRDAIPSRLRLHLSDGVIREVPLSPTGSRLYSARIAGLSPGRYPITIVERSPRSGASEHADFLTVSELDDDALKEYRRREPNLSLLTALTEGTGGALNPATREIIRRSTGRRRAAYPLDRLLVPAAMLLLLGDIAARRAASRRD